MMAGRLPRALRPTAVALSALLGAVVLAHLAYSVFDFGRRSNAAFFDYWLVALGLAAVAGLCVVRAVAVREQRAAWLSFAVAVLLFASGGVYAVVAL